MLRFLPVGARLVIGLVSSVLLAVLLGWLTGLVVRKGGVGESWLQLSFCWLVWLGLTVALVYQAVKRRRG